MSVNLLSVLDNIAAPVVVATPIKDPGGKITDFDIIYTNEELKKAASHVLQNKPRWSDFSMNITSDIPWFKMALDAIAGRFYDDIKYFSPSTQAWYKIEMKWLPEEKYIIISFINIKDFNVFNKFTVNFIDFFNDFFRSNSFFNH